MVEDGGDSMTDDALVAYTIGNLVDSLHEYEDAWAR
jgi:hypothetical protein